MVVKNKAKADEFDHTIKLLVLGDSGTSHVSAKRIFVFSEQLRTCAIIQRQVITFHEAEVSAGLVESCHQGHID